MLRPLRITAMQFTIIDNYAHSFHRKPIVLERPSSTVIRAVLVEMGYRSSVADVVAYGTVDSEQARRLAREVGLTR